MATKCDDMMYQNARIKKIGYYFCGHANAGGIRVHIETERGECEFDLDRKLVGKFIEAVDDRQTLDVENGIYIEELAGMPFVAWFSDEGRGPIYAVAPILCPSDMLVVNGKE